MMTPLEEYLQKEEIERLAASESCSNCDGVGTVDDNHRDVCDNYDSSQRKIGLRCLSLADFLQVILPRCGRMPIAFLSLECFARLSCTECCCSSLQARALVPPTRGRFEPMSHGLQGQAIPSDQDMVSQLLVGRYVAMHLTRCRLRILWRVRVYVYSAVTATHA